MSEELIEIKSRDGAMGKLLTSVLIEIEDRTITLDDYRLRITKLEVALKLAREALINLACFNDTGGDARLEKSGSYTLFDEPNSVKISRATLPIIDEALK